MITGFSAIFEKMLQSCYDRGRFDLALKVVREDVERGHTPIGAVWVLRPDDRLASRILVRGR